MPGVSRGANLLLAIGSVLVTVAAVELGLRLTRPHSLSPELQPLVYEADPELGYHYRPGAVGRVVRGFEMDNVVHINALGFHDVARDPASTRRPRIVAIGDSFTAAKHVPVEHGWTQTLERALRADGLSDAEVWNLGLDGTGTDAHVALLERWVSRLRPDLVLVAFYENDARDVAERRQFREDYRGFVLGYLDEAQRDTLRAFVDARAPGAAARFLFAHVWTSRPLMRLVPAFDLVRTNYVTPSRVDLPVKLARHDAPPLATHFHRLDALARRHGFRVVVTPVPPKRHPRSSRRKLERGLGPGDLAALDVVDVRESMVQAVARDGRRWDDLYWAYDDHFDADGHAVFGASLAPEIVGRLGTSGSRGAP